MAEPAVRARFTDAVRAIVELAIARVRLERSWSTETLAEPVDGAQHLDLRQRRLVERVAFAIPRVAARLPWRADCMVQALAARRWLDRAGIATTISVGVAKDMPASFEAHAWLTVGETVVTGGDVSRYVRFER